MSLAENIDARTPTPPPSSTPTKKKRRTRTPAPPPVAEVVGIGDDDNETVVGRLLDDLFAGLGVLATKYNDGDELDSGAVELLNVLAHKATAARAQYAAEGIDQPTGVATPDAYGFLDEMGGQKLDEKHEMSGGGGTRRIRTRKKLDASFIIDEADHIRRSLESLYFGAEFINGENCASDEAVARLKELRDDFVNGLASLRFILGKVEEFAGKEI